MAKGVDRTEFLSEPTRMRIAEMCRGQALTFEEIARRLGRTLGSLSQPATMVKHGALVRERRSRQRADDRGGATAFCLSRRWEGALDEARQRQRPAWGQLRQDLLLIPLSETPAACAAIAEGIPEIEWGAEITGERLGLVVAPQSGGDGTSTSRVIRALADVGQIARLHLERTMSPHELRTWSQRVVSGPEKRELPPSA